MPLESVAINNFENNSIDDPELKLRVDTLYDSSPEFATGRDAVAIFDKAFAKGAIQYFLLKIKAVKALARPWQAVMAFLG